MGQYLNCPFCNPVGTAFKGNTTIVKFNEFERFTKNVDIRYEAFSGCSKLQSIKLPDTAYKIGYSCFSNCTSLSIVDFPPSITTIASWMFTSCRCHLIFRSVTPPTGVSASEWGRTFGSGNIYVPNELVDIYKEQWNRVVSKIKPLSDLG